MNRRSRWLNPSIVFLLLWGAMVFALHTHHDEMPGSDSECQVCLYASHSGTVVPETASTLSRVVSIVTVSNSLIETVFITPQIRTQKARAPPAIS